MLKSLDTKLKILAENPHADCFILADAKDGDMARGTASAGKDRAGRPRPLSVYREEMREIVRQGFVDIMLMSASSSEILTLEERLFDQSSVTPAVRANDTTDIHLVRGACYSSQPSRPFASATIDHIQAGKSPCLPTERRLGSNLGLYSITFNNNPATDLEAMEAYKAFRLEAEAKGFRHFLEVFTPNVAAAEHGLNPEDIPGFVNDHIARLLAGVPKSSRPSFLKIPYMGAAALEDLCTYDPSIVVGVLGGSAGTTHDAFKLVEDSKRHGARVALFGRKIVAAESQLAFVEHLKHVGDGALTAADAVKSYHDALAKQGIGANRSLEQDLQVTDPVFGYAG